MRVTMLKTIDGSPDGMRVLTYREGEIHDLPDDLARNFVGQGAAKAVPKRKGRPSSRNKAIDTSESNK